MVSLAETCVEGCNVEWCNIATGRLADQIVKPGLHSAFIAGHRVRFPNQVCGSGISIGGECFLPLRDCFPVHAFAIVGACQTEVGYAEVGLQLQSLLVLLNRMIVLMRIVQSI